MNGLLKRNVYIKERKRFAVESFSQLFCYGWRNSKVVSWTDENQCKRILVEENQAGKMSSDQLIDHTNNREK